MKSHEDRVGDRARRGSGVMNEKRKKCLCVRLTAGSFSEHRICHDKGNHVFDWKRSSSKVSFLWLTFFFVSLLPGTSLSLSHFFSVAIEVYFCFKISYCSFMAVGESITANDRFAAVPHKLFVYQKSLPSKRFQCKSGKYFYQRICISFFFIEREQIASFAMASLNLSIFHLKGFWEVSERFMRLL